MPACTIQLNDNDAHENFQKNQRIVAIWRDFCVALDQGDEAAQWLSDYLQQPVRLVRLADNHKRRVNPAYAISPQDETSFADGYPILLISQASLDELNGRLSNPLPMNRFRPNLVVTGCAAFAEDGWKRIRIGEVELALVKLCARCQITTIDQETLETSKEPLATLAQYRYREDRGVMFGQNLIPVKRGAIKIGDSVEIIL